MSLHSVSTTSMSSPLTAVIVPLYNKRQHVVRAIHSVLSQTYHHIEIVVVDDGSTDGSVDVLSAISDPRLRIIRQPNLGPGAARNRGWKSTSGSLVAFLDADDYWDDDYLEWSIAHIIKDPSIAAVTSGYRELHSGGKIQLAEEISEGLSEGEFRAVPGELRRFATHLKFMLPITTVVRREILVRYGGFYDLNRCLYGEDNFLWTQVLLNHPVYFGVTPRATVDRKASSLSVLRSLDNRQIEPLLTHSDLIRAKCPAHLRALLNALLTERAFKRTCTLAMSGRWQEAQALRKRYSTNASTIARYRILSRLTSNPIGSALARLTFKLIRNWLNR